MENTYYEGANERILARVPAEARRILDVGCAAGRLGEIIKANGAIPSGHLPLANYDLPEKEVWGIEAVPSVAQEAKRRLDHVIVGDVEAMDPLPLPERYFDCVICGDVLEHLKEPGVLLQRLKKHLVPAPPSS